MSKTSLNRSSPKKPAAQHRQRGVDGRPRARPAVAAVRLRIGRGWLNRKISLLRTPKIWPGHVARARRRTGRRRTARRARAPASSGRRRASSAPGVSLGIESIIRVQANGATAFERTPNFLHVERDRLRQRDDAELGGAVVRLPEVADQARRRGHVHVAAARLRLEVRRGGAADVEAAASGGRRAPRRIRAPLMRWNIASRRMPALLTTMSMRPNAISAASTIVCAAPSRRPSRHRRSPAPPIVSICATTSLRRLLVARPAPSRVAPRSLTTTLGAGLRHRQGDAAADAAAAAGDQRHLAFRAIGSMSRLLGCRDWTGKTSAVRAVHRVVDHIVR